MQSSSHALLADLQQRTDNALQAATTLKQLSQQQLNFKPVPEKWSALECLEHLNLYGDFYLPAIERSIFSRMPVSSDLVFKSGVIGNYFAELMQVTAGKIKKMRSPKDKNPVNKILPATTADRFIKQLERLQELLQQAHRADLTKSKTPVSISNFIRLRLGDTLRFFIYHIERHVLQAKGAAESFEKVYQTL